MESLNQSQGFSAKREAAQPASRGFPVLSDRRQRVTAVADGCITLFTTNSPIR